MKSFVWNHFTKHGKDQANCEHCGQTLLCKGACTSGLIKHLRSKHREIVSTLDNLTESNEAKDFNRTFVGSSETVTELQKQNKKLKEELKLKSRFEEENLELRAKLNEQIKENEELKKVIRELKYNVRNDETDLPKITENSVKCLSMEEFDSILNSNGNEYLENNTANSISNKKSTKVSIFECDYCEKTFESRKRLNYHVGKFHEKMVKSKRVKNKAKCEYCGKSYADISGYWQHVRAIHQAKKFKCIVCEKNFSYKKTLDIHMRSHDGKKYECDRCSKYFSAPQSLYRHKKSHK